MKTSFLIIAVALAIVAPAPVAKAQAFCEEPLKLDDADLDCYRLGPTVPPIPFVPKADPDPRQLRLLKYAQVAIQHKLTGLASYYSTSLNGTLTANGEHYYNKRLSAAHLTLPLGSWVEIKSK